MLAEIGTTDGQELGLEIDSEILPRRRQRQKSQTAEQRADPKKRIVIVLSYDDRANRRPGKTVV